jgi:hypothetical protein
MEIWPTHTHKHTHIKRPFNHFYDNGVGDGHGTGSLFVFRLLDGGGTRRG